MSTQSAWNQRAFVVLGAVLSGLALPVTGAAGFSRRLPTKETLAAASLVGVVLAATVVHARAEG